MDVETASAIALLSDRVESVGDRVDSLHEKVELLGRSLRTEMVGMHGGLRAEMAGMQTGLRAEMAGMQTGLRAEMAGMQTGLRGELREGLAENRRHSEVLSESLRDDIRILAEGFATLSARLDSSRR